MSERTRHLRNAAIIVVLAGAVYALPGGGQAAGGVSNLLTVMLFAGLAFFAYRLYMEHRTTLLDLPEDQRRLLYGSTTLLIVALLATGALWNADSRLWILVWFALIAVAAAGVAALVRRRNEA